jgi:hypothetical protein
MLDAKHLLGHATRLTGLSHSVTDTRSKAALIEVGR